MERAILKIGDAWAENEIGCTGIDFNTITDYVLIISVLLKKYGITKTEISKFVNDYEKIIEEFRNKISISIYNKIIYSDTKNKLSDLRKFIKS